MKASAFLRRKVSALLPGDGKRVLDAPCGRGRNALYLQTLGFNIVGVDRDQAVLQVLEDAASMNSGGTVETVLMDFDNDDWIFPDESFDVVMNIHYVSLSLLPRLLRGIRRGGTFLMETFENRGENYLELPGAGSVKKIVQAELELLVYEERAAGPAGCNAVTVRVLGRRR